MFQRIHPLADLIEVYDKVIFKRRVRCHRLQGDAVGHGPAGRVEDCGECLADILLPFFPIGADTEERLIAFGRKQCFPIGFGRLLPLFGSPCQFDESDG